MADQTDPNPGEPAMPIEQPAEPVGPEIDPAGAPDEAPQLNPSDPGDWRPRD